MRPLLLYLFPSGRLEPLYCRRQTFVPCYFIILCSVNANFFCIMIFILNSFLGEFFFCLIIYTYHQSIKHKSEIVSV